MMNLRSIFSLTGFILTFPMLLLVFVFSESFLGENYFSLYFAASISFFSFIGFIIFIADSRIKPPKPLPTILLFFIFNIMVLTVSAYSFFTVQRIGGFSLLANAISGCAQILGTFFIVYYWDFDSRIHRICAIASMLATAVLVLLFTQEGTVTSDVARAFDPNATSVAYQMIGRVVVFCGIFAVISSRNVVLSAILVAMGVAALYQNGARTEFLLFFLATSAMIFLSTFKKIVTFYAMLGAMAVVIIFLVTNSDAILDMLPQSRVLEVFRLDQSTSWDARAIAYQYAKDTIASAPILGDYGSDFDRFGPGLYAHNIASAWVEIGLFGFVITLILLIRPLFFSLRWAFQGAQLPSVQLCIGTAIYSALGYAFSYYYLTAYIGLSVAAFVRAWNDVAAGRRGALSTA